jgi:acetyl-CoA acetyltransferase
VDRDEHPRPDATLEALAALRPVLVESDPGATVTAGNGCGHNDAPPDASSSRATALTSSACGRWPGS